MNAIIDSTSRFITIQQDDTTPEDPHGNYVTYRLHPDGQLGPAVWDRRSFEASQGQAPEPSIPQPVTPEPEPPPEVARPVQSVQVTQVTDSRDGRLIHRMNSYYSSAWIAPTGDTYLFVGHEDGHPRFFEVDPSGRVLRVQELQLEYTGEADGWYWDETGSIYVIAGPELHRVNPFTGEDRTVLNIRASHPDCDLWQAHSSTDGRTHCASVRRIVQNGAYPKIGVVVSRRGYVTYYPVQREPLDESAVTAEGRYVVIKEGLGPDNRVIDLDTEQERWIEDGARALGHSDAGRNSMIGEADKPDPGQCGVWDYPSLSYRPLFNTTNMGHLSVRADRILLSDDQSISLVSWGGVRTPLLNHGMVNDDPSRDPYDFQVQANLDNSGRCFCYMSNRGGGRMDVFLARLR